VRQQADGATLRADNAEVTTQYLFSEPQQGSHRRIIMRTTFTKKQLGLAVACVLTLGVFSATASAQVRDVNEKALLTDTRGGPVMSGSGLCWHSSFGPAPEWTQGCHAYVPAPVAQYVAPVAPAPVVKAAVWEKVAFDANVLFDSDKSALRPAGRDTLDQFVNKLHGLDSQSIFAIGYADRMGTDADNQVLSQQRVDTVKAYLVGQGIAPSRVQTSAKGETRPTTFAGECKDANNPKNVACMQPDRHVFIEVSGSRIAK
jgi:OmpA-OmpF porin, OOP family